MAPRPVAPKAGFYAINGKERSGGVKYTPSLFAINVVI
jgi:hypothetical protein